MLRPIKLTALSGLRGLGFFRMVTNSRWRQQRLLILCYHGVSLEDEHLWRPLLYIDPRRLEQRLAFLKKGDFSMLPLGESLQRLRAGTLPPRSVALTFDDGGYDFFRQAYPLLRKYDFPATVYQTTYYSPLERPVFNLICSYMLWTRRGQVITNGEGMGLDRPMDLRTDAGRAEVMRALVALSERGDKTALEKDAIAAQLAGALKIDYASLLAKRILQLMNARELLEISRSGVDVQLHTHRHRAPESETLFRREIQDNRSKIQEYTATLPVHFCYPSGVYRPCFLPWLREEQVVSATTCDAGLATQQSDSLLLPRFIDHQNRSQIEFESWISGIGDLLAWRGMASQHPPPGRRK